MNKNLIPWRRKAEAPERSAQEHPFEALHRQMNDVFEQFFGEVSGRSLQPWSNGGSLQPRFEVTESDDAVDVSAELPGMDEKDIQVTLDDNLLTIKGEKKQEREEKRKNTYFTERSYGYFERSLAVPAGVDKDKVKATFKKGVLHLALPKTEKARTEVKKIAISAD